MRAETNYVGLGKRLEERLGTLRRLKLASFRARKRSYILYNIVRTQGSSETGNDPQIEYQWPE